MYGILPRDAPPRSPSVLETLASRETHTHTTQDFLHARTYTHTHKKKKGKKKAHASLFLSLDSWDTRTHAHTHSLAMSCRNPDRGFKVKRERKAPQSQNRHRGLTLAKRGRRSFVFDRGGGEEGRGKVTYWWFLFFRRLFFLSSSLLGEGSFFSTSYEFMVVRKSTCKTDFYILVYLGMFSPFCCFSSGLEGAALNKAGGGGGGWVIRSYIHTNG
ncbi:hypothetical protein F4809DRAFT_478696 [Biscogniauxia mediterranea]|nr:hypothetical protein F4809DRAFT_478696 [Biscogniauxia mediterranea]